MFARMTVNTLAFLPRNLRGDLIVLAYAMVIAPLATLALYRLFV